MKAREMQTHFDRFVPPSVQTTLELKHDKRRIVVTATAKWGKKGVEFVEYLRPDRFQSPAELYSELASIVGMAVSRFALTYNEATLGASLPDVREEMRLDEQDQERGLSL